MNSSSDFSITPPPQVTDTGRVTPHNENDRQQRRRKKRKDEPEIRKLPDDAETEPDDTEEDESGREEPPHFVDYLI
ncbi:MAG: hypothetical protein ACLFVU_14145 [Phycisphaerae bacterium]